jgi:predicted transglutaminase-like cysteine proteinase
MGRGAKKTLARCALASSVALVLLAAPNGGRAEERPLFISIGDTTKAPIGWVEFCVEYDPECKTKSSQPRDVVFSTQAWKDLERINLHVNNHIKPMTDLEHLNAGIIPTTAMATARTMFWPNVAC